ncbi:MAG TPA: DNA primase [Bacteroidia bacterium]|nr:DNA primase [Bacteroidia bacterium]
MIKKETIEQIVDTARIEEVVGDFVTLKKRGANLLGLCPFHNEKTPSFTVSPAKGIYKCFGCGKAGNSVNFIMEHEQLSYPEALRMLAQKYHILIDEEQPSAEQQIENNNRDSLYIVSSFAQKLFTENLHQTDEGKSVGLSYFRERGFTKETIEKFQLGYCLDEWRGFTDAAITAGYKLEYLVQTGLTISSANEKVFDRFSGRVMFPIHNVSGKVIAFGGRVLKKDEKTAKYINSPESDIYHKSQVLYGIFFARKSMVATDSCFLVEGYTDVISMHQAGIENVVASSGTSLTVEQIRLIRRYTKNITILYDGDAAGIKASFRGIDLVLEEGLNVKVLLFPNGEDPDSFSKKVSSEEYKKFIAENATDFIAFKTKLLFSEAKKDPIKKAALIKDIIDSIAIIPEAITRSLYVKECSVIMEIEEQILLNELNKVFRKKISQRQKDNILPENETTSEYVENNPTNVAEYFIDNCEHQEFDLIRILITHGSKKISVEAKDEEGKDFFVESTIFEIIQQQLQIDAILFENPVYQKIFSAFVKIDEVEKMLPEHDFFTQHPDEEIQKITIDILSTPYQLSENWEKRGILVNTEEMLLKKAVWGAIYALKGKKIEKMLSENNRLLKEEKSDDKIFELISQRIQLNEAKKRFNALLGRIIIK